MIGVTAIGIAVIPFILLLVGAILGGWEIIKSKGESAVAWAVTSASVGVILAFATSWSRSIHF